MNSFKVKNIEKVEYQHFCADHYLPVFYQSWWLDLVCNNWQAKILHAQNAVFVLICPVEKKIGFKLIRTPMFTPYLGLYNITKGVKIEEKKILHALQKYSHLTFQTFPGEELISSVNQFTKKIRNTYRIELNQSIDAIFLSFDAKRRNDIRKAQKDLHIEEYIINPSEFILWHQIPYKNKNTFYPYSVSFFEKLFITAKQHKASICYCAKNNEGETMAIVWMLKDEHIMYNMLTATSPTHKHRGAIAWLIWQCIQDAKNMGLSYFDFEGSMDPGIADFFEKFGGKLEHYHVYTHTPSKLWEWKQKFL